VESRRTEEEEGRIYAHLIIIGIVDEFMHAQKIDRQ
jgi:hypothetical protein